MQESLLAGYWESIHPFFASTLRCNIDTSSTSNFTNNNYYYRKRLHPMDFSGGDKRLG